MKKVIINCLIFLIVLNTFVISGFSNLEVFTKYNTEINIYNNDTLQISKHVLLRNIHKVGIVPGEIQFKIYNPSPNKDVNIKNISVTNRYGKEIKHQILNIDNGYVVLLDIFTPILPGSEYVININALMDCEPTGFLFRNLQIPLKENSSIPINSGQVTLKLPNYNHLTYTNFQNNNTKFDNKTITWNIDKGSPQSINVEYSIIPIKIGDFRGSVIFWTIINIILISMLIIHIRKAIEKNKNSSHKTKRK